LVDLKKISSETAWPNELQFGRNIIGRLSLKIAHFVPIRKQTWRHRHFLFLVGRVLKIFFSEATWREAPMEGSVLSFLKAE
jgi:hypothetical protein